MRAATVGSVLLLVGCAREHATRTSAAPVVYGTDDRVDVYADTDPVRKSLAENAIVAMIPVAALDQSDPTDVRVMGETLGRVEHLCAGERFSDQTTAAECSATLIDDDLVLTAGHCVQNLTLCRAYKWVFNYRYDTPGTLHPLTHDDVYSCAAIVVRSEQNRPTLADYAVIRLDRPATPRFVPADVETRAIARTDGSGVVVIGFGSGLPAKIDPGGTVRDARASALDSFVATTDTFGGNSGSGVFDGNASRLVGILIEGEQDYVRQGNCAIVNRCAEDECSGETIEYAHVATDALCAALPTARPCPGFVPRDAGATASDAAVQPDANVTADGGDYAVQPGCACASTPARARNGGAWVLALVTAATIRRKRSAA